MSSRNISTLVSWLKDLELSGSYRIITTCQLAEGGSHILPRSPCCVLLIYMRPKGFKKLGHKETCLSWSHTARRRCCSIATQIAQWSSLVHYRSEERRVGKEGRSRGS